MTITTMQIQGSDGERHDVPLLQGAEYDTPIYNLPEGAATPANQELASALLTAIATYLDTEVAAILAKLAAGLPAALGTGGGLKIDGSGTPVPVSGTFYQVTQPVSAASLPLPSGAATAAKQPALGTAGTASADVLTVQGIAGGTSIPISGTVTATVSGVATAANQTGGSQKTQLVDAAANVLASEENVDGDHYLGTAMVQHVHADPNNSSTTNLDAPGYTFTGTKTSTLGVAGLQVSLYADKNCIVYVEQSPDESNWDLSDKFFYTSDENFGVTVQAINSWVRVRVTTMSETTTEFRLQTCLCPVVEAVPRTLDEGGHFKVSIKKDQYDNGPARFSLQEDMIVVERSRLIGSQFDGSTLDTNFWTSAVSTGTVAQSNGNVTITSGTANGHYARLYSKRRARYVTGEGNSLRMNIRLPDAGTANVRRRWGIAWGATMPTVTDGAFFQLDGETFSVVILKNNAATTISSGSFNGRYGYTLVPGTSNRTYRIAWNNAKIKFMVDTKLLHTFTASAETWANTIHHHIWMEAYNSGNSAAVAMYTRNAGVHRHGPLATQATSYYQAGQTAGVVLKYGPGCVHGISLTGVQNNSVVTLYDNTAASGTILWASGSMGAGTAPFDVNMFNIPFNIGLTLVVATANSNVMVAYE